MFATVSSYVVLSLMLFTAIILLLIIIHIFGIIKIHQNNPLIPADAKRKKVLLLRLTIFGIICFECSIVLIAILLLQLVLIDSNLSLTAYHEFEYVIFLLDAIGHIVIIYAFSARFEWCFKGTLNQCHKRCILLLRVTLLLITIFSIVILILMIVKQYSPKFIFALDMAEELVLNVLTLSLFYMFIAHSYRLITMSFPKNNQFRDFVHHLADKYRLKKLAMYASNTSKQLVMTIDGVPALPVYGVSKQEESSSNSNGKSEDKKQRVWQVPGHSEPDDLVNVMSRKMLLATMVVICSTLNMSVVISMEVLRSGEIRDAQTIWLCMLIVFDMLVSTLMLYLQFTFNHRLYWKLCSKMDLMWMKVVLKIVRCCWVREHQHRSQHLKPMLQEQQKYEKFRDQQRTKQSDKKEVKTNDGIEIVVERAVSVSATDGEEERP